MQSNDIFDKDNPPLVVKLNRVIEASYPTGAVDYVEVIRACMAVATAYQRALEGHSPTHANLIQQSAERICEWMAADKM